MYWSKNSLYLSIEKELCSYRTMLNLTLQKRRVNFLFELGLGFLLYLSYSPNISPHDCYLFLSMDNYMRDIYFRNKEELKMGVSTFFALKNDAFYQFGIKNLFHVDKR